MTIDTMVAPGWTPSLSAQVRSWGIEDFTGIQTLAIEAGVADGRSMIACAPTSSGKTTKLYATLNELNPKIPFAQHRLRVITEAEPFPAGYPVAAASVNGFGYGGTNAHAILVAAPAYALGIWGARRSSGWPARSPSGAPASA